MTLSQVRGVSKTTIALERRNPHGLDCAGLCLAMSACASHAIDVGAVPDQTLSNPADAGGLGGGAALADAGSSSGVGSGSSTCSLPNLEQYRLVFDSDGSKLERRIYSMRADGSDLQPLTPPDVLACEPAVSPDGAQLAYTTPDGIQLLDIASGSSELLAATPGADEPIPNSQVRRALALEASGSSRTLDPGGEACPGPAKTGCEIGSCRCLNPRGNIASLT
jgi:hypothetical protein